MITAVMKATFHGSIDHIWKLVTDLNQQQWRSQVDRIEVLDEKRFIEYDRDGYSMSFTITQMIFHEIYEFDMQNKNMEGHWSGQFQQLENGDVEIEFTEKVEVKNMFMKLFAKKYLEKQQKQYISDLRRVLDEKGH